MRRREDRSISKHTLNLYQGDYLSLQTYYGSRIGAAKIIRDLVRIHVKKIRGEAEQKVDTLVLDPLAPELEGIMEERVLTSTQLIEEGKRARERMRGKA